MKEIKVIGLDLAKQVFWGKPGTDHVLRVLRSEKRERTH